MENKKVAVIGSPDIVSMTNRDGEEELVLIDMKTSDPVETLEIKHIPMKTPFVPRAKHCLKGHQRPYKFHR